MDPNAFPILGSLEIETNPQMTMNPKRVSFGDSC